MSLGDDNRASQLNVLKTKIVADLPRDARPSIRDASLRGGLEDRSLRVGSAAQGRHHHEDYDSALRLVHRASEAIDMLQDRCRRLEADARDISERLKSEAESSERVIKDWERLATAIKTQLNNSFANLAEMQMKLEAADERATALEALAKSTEERLQATETRARAAEARAEAAEQLAAREGEIASTLRDTIIETFGTGSRLSSTLSGDHGD